MLSFPWRHDLTDGDGGVAEHPAFSVLAARESSHHDGLVGRWGAPTRGSCKLSSKFYTTTWRGGVIGCVRHDTTHFIPRFFRLQYCTEFPVTAAQELYSLVRSFIRCFVGANKKFAICTPLVGWLVGSCNRAFRAITRGNCGVGGKELGRGRMEGVLNRPQRAHECGEGGTRSGPAGGLHWYRFLSSRHLWIMCSDILM